MKLRLFLLMLMATIGAQAQSPSKVLSRANKALGGEKVLKSVRSWRASGTIVRKSDGASGRYESVASGGNLYAGEFDLDGFEYAVGYNGKSGWMRDSLNGLRTLTGTPAKDFQAEAIYRNSRWLNAKAEKTKITLGGSAPVDGKPASVVILNTAKGVRIKLFFDQVTGLLVREELPEGAIGKSFDYGDYRDVNGIRTPFFIVSKVADDIFEVKLESVTYNETIEAAKFDFPRVSNEPLPDIKALFDEIRANAEKIDEILEDYSYTELRIDREVGPNGELVEKSSEKRLLTFYKGYRINRLIERNGRPLSASDQEKEDRDAQKQVAEIESKIAEKDRKLSKQRETGSGTGGQPNGDGQRITIADALKGSLLKNPRRERYRNNDVIVFDYEPNPDFKPTSRMEKLFALCTGAVWVDTKTKQVVRLDAVLTKSAGNFIAKAKRGASFTIENTLINNEIWLPSQADVNLSIKILFAGININNLIRYGDYSKFKTEVTGSSVDEVKKP
jgi:hypothetical protein